MSAGTRGAQAQPPVGGARLHAWARESSKTFLQAWVEHHAARVGESPQRKPAPRP